MLAAGFSGCKIPSNGVSGTARFSPAMLVGARNKGNCRPSVSRRTFVAWMLACFSAIVRFSSVTLRCFAYFSLRMVSSTSSSLSAEIQASTLSSSLE